MGNYKIFSNRGTYDFNKEKKYNDEARKIALWFKNQEALKTTLILL